MATTKDIAILQGKTFTLVLRWETAPIIYKAISAISLASGAPRLTVTGHGLPDGWRCAVQRVQGMTPINAKNSPPKDKDYQQASVIDANTIELNSVSPVDENGNEWPAYVSGGFVLYNTPASLAGFTARMAIKDKIGGTLLHSLTTENAGIALYDTNKTITLTIPATATDDFAWKKGVYDLEMVSGTGVVTLVMHGKVELTKEVTT
ncbi:MAG: hypothetical protein E6Q97_04775 [Desulfurellales bacterium]|nr:MAG: hypothetical protein E6Q97_04775 [Desulfurellales bacterium]